MIAPHGGEPDDSTTVRERVWRLASFPATLAHEVLHMIASLPWADRGGIVFGDGPPECRVVWQDDAPDWGLILASLAPTFVGAGVGIVGLWLLVTHRPNSAREWLLAAAAAAEWVIFVAPSGDDLETAQTRQTTAETDNTDS